MKKNYLKNIIWVLGLFVLSGCSEQFLDKKPDKALLVPSTLSDYQALLDNITVFNNAPALGQIAADDFYITDAGYQGLTVLEQNTYSWQTDVYGGTLMISDWNVPYQQVFYANVVMDGIASLDLAASEQSTYEIMQASALFYRALAFYNLTQMFAVGYNPAAAGTTSGIPVRLQADVEKLSLNMSLQQCYEQILSDLSKSVEKLPALTANRNRPSSASAYALIARVNLAMSRYDPALEAANKSLGLSSSLLDYNTLDSLKAVPFPLALPSGNPEVLFYDCLLNYGYLNNALTQVDTMLAKTYKPGDLRAKLFFQKSAMGGLSFRGTYTGSIAAGTNSGLFCGLATDEMYLIKAECLARTGQTQKAIETLNTLLENRFQNASFVPINAADPDAALAIVLLERRKELVGRGLRWSDLKRLNQQKGFALDLKREVGLKQYALPANDARYKFPVPASEQITARQGI